MARYIDADKLIAYFIKPYSLTEFIANTDVQQIIRDMPTEEVTPIVRGKWNDWYFENGYTDAFHCQKCQHLFAVTQGRDNMNFCPNCGAKMKESEKPQ